MTKELVRLFCFMEKILKENMQYEEGYIEEMPDLTGLNSENISNLEKSRMLEKKELKKGSISIEGYKYICSMVRRLVESCELFLEVNQRLINKEKMK